MYQRCCIETQDILEFYVNQIKQLKKLFNYLKDNFIQLIASNSYQVIIRKQSKMLKPKVFKNQKVEELVLIQKQRRESHETAFLDSDKNDSIVEKGKFYIDKFFPSPKNSLTQKSARKSYIQVTSSLDRKNNKSSSNNKRKYLIDVTVSYNRTNSSGNTRTMKDQNSHHQKAESLMIKNYLTLRQSQNRTKMKMQRKKDFNIIANNSSQLKKQIDTPINKLNNYCKQ